MAKTRKQPAMMFYTGDWLKDSALSLCNLSTRGIWIDLLCRMHEDGRSGELRGTTEQLSRLARCTTAEIEAAMSDLRSTNAADVTFRNGVWTVINRRMARDFKDNISNAKRQNDFRERGGGDPDRWTAIRAPILVRDKKMCAYCGRSAKTVDHVVPKSKGGSHYMNNLVACCKRCNSAKNNRTPEEAQMTFWRGFDVSVLAPPYGNNTEITPASSSSASAEDTPLPPADDAAALPPSLSGDDFREAWADWCSHREEMRKPLTPTAIKLQLKKCAKWGVKKSIATINLAIEKGWQGLWPKDDANELFPTKEHTADDIDRMIGLE